MATSEILLQHFFKVQVIHDTKHTIITFDSLDISNDIILIHII